MLAALLLLTTILFGLIGCYPAHPPYQPLAPWDISPRQAYPPFQPLLGGESPPRQGYVDYQIDAQTFLITYFNYGMGPYDVHFFEDPVPIKLQNKWLKGAQEYVLYRAAELARSRGIGWILVLYRDDWNHIGSFKPYRGSRVPVIKPGASVLIRFLETSSSESRQDVHEVEMLLKTLPKMNRGLPGAPKFPAREKEYVKTSSGPFSRWRTTSAPFGSVPLTSDGLNISAYSPETKVAKVSTDRFEIERWGFAPLSPIMFLGECVKVAEREGHEFFVIENWIEEEHRDYASVWFKTGGMVVLHKSMPEDSDAVFRVTEIKANVHLDTIKLRWKADRDKLVDRDLDAGLIY